MGMSNACDGMLPRGMHIIRVGLCQELALAGTGQGGALGGACLLPCPHASLHRQGGISEHGNPGSVPCRRCPALLGLEVSYRWGAQPAWCCAWHRALARGLA